MSDVLICVPVRMEAVAGSVIQRGTCGHDVWIAPSGQRMLAGIEKVVCMDCAPALLKADPGKLMPPSAEQLAEIAAHEDLRGPRDG